MEEFVCFRTTGDQIRLGTGKVITTPSGNVQVVCTGKPPQPVDSEPEPDDPGLEPEPIPEPGPEEPDPEPAG